MGTPASRLWRRSRKRPGVEHSKKRRWTRKFRFGQFGSDLGEVVLGKLCLVAVRTEQWARARRRGDRRGRAKDNKKSKTTKALWSQTVGAAQRNRIEKLTDVCGGEKGSPFIVKETCLEKKMMLHEEMRPTTGRLSSARKAGG